MSHAASDPWSVDAERCCEVCADKTPNIFTACGAAWHLSRESECWVFSVQTEERADEWR
jgi:hypothetical protein